MKNYIYICLLGILILGNTVNLKAQDVVFTDEKFKQVLLDLTDSNGVKLIDKDNSNSISQTEAADFSEPLDVSGQEISSLEGIEYFTGVSVLNCSDNELKILNLGNLELQELICNDNLFSFSALQAIREQFSALTYNSDKKILDLQSVAHDALIDYSSEASISTNPTTFVWYDAANDEELDTNSLEVTDDGIFQFTEPGIYYCQMSNPLSFPDLLLQSNTITINIHIPNTDFETKMLNMCDTDGNGMVSVTEAAAYQGPFNNHLNLDSQGLTDVRGIEYLTGIRILTINNNQLSSLNLNNSNCNMTLENLECKGNQLNSLIVDQCPNLMVLECNNNNLRSLNLSKNNTLVSINIYDNKFPLSALKQIEEDVQLTNDNYQYPEVSYESDSLLFEPEEGPIAYEVDYSAEAAIEGTIFTWYKNITDASGEIIETEVEEGEVEEKEGGVFRFLQAGTYHCKMYNPGIMKWNWQPTILQTEKISILNHLNIPDPNFKRTLVDNTNINENGDEEISPEEAAAFSGILVVSSANIEDLSGIEYFTQISGLDCSGNLLTTLDLSLNKQLNNLNCNNNKFPFTALLEIKENFSELSYSSDKNIFEALEENYGFTIDYTKQSTFEEQTSTFEWFDQEGNELSEIQIQKVSTGLYQFTTPGTFYCRMQNSAFGETVLQTENITIHAGTVYIPDLNFKQALLDNSSINIVPDQEISFEEAFLFREEIEVSDQNISELTGIEAFVNISGLNCSQNLLNNLDVSKNTALHNLNCSDNDLSNLNLNQNENLESLNCDHNRFPFSALQEIRNDFSGLDYSTDKKLFTALEKGCGFEADYSEELSVNGFTTQFFWFDEKGEALSESTIENLESGIFKLTESGSYHCIMKNVSFPHLELQTEDISITDILYIPDENFKNALLQHDDPIINTLDDGEISVTEAAALTEELDVSNHDISDLTGIEFFPNIKVLNCGYNHLSSINLIRNTALTKLFCTRNFITHSDSIKQGENPILEILGCSANQISSLNLKKWPNLKEFYGNYINASQLVFQNNTALTNIYCRNNELSNLDLRECPNLQYLSCDANQLTSINLSMNTKLNQLIVSDNELNSLDLSNTNITNGWYLVCHDNRLPFSNWKQIKDQLIRNFDINYVKTDKAIFYEQEGTYGFTVNYQSEKKIGDYETTFTWYDEGGNDVTGDAVLEPNDDGIFEFVKAGVFHCVMENGYFSGEQVQTNTISISENLYIPDAHFKQELLSNEEINKDSSQEISWEEASLFTGTLDISGKEIEDLSGIEYFTSITGLDCSDNLLSSLDLSQNTALTSLDCTENKFPLSAIKEIWDLFPWQDYSSFKPIYAPLEESYGFRIDYQNEVWFANNETTFTWYDENGNDVSGTAVLEGENKGVFDFVRSGTFHCVMTNPYFSAIQVETDTIHIESSIQTISFKPPTSFLVNDTYELIASSNSNLEVRFEIPEEDAEKAAISNNTVYFFQAGEVTIIAVQDGDGRYASVRESVKVFVGKKTQNISFDLPFSFKVNDKYLLSAGSDAALEIRYEIAEEDRDKATISQDTIHFLQAGEVNITAIQEGDHEYENAQKSVRVLVNRKTQSINFENDFSALEINQVLELSVSTNSSLPVRFEIAEEDEEKADISENKITFLQAGTVTIMAIQEGNNEYESTQSTVTVSVSKKEQSITFFDLPEEVYVNGVFEINAVASSQLEVNFMLLEGNAGIHGDSITFTGEGIVKIMAIQEGNYEYLPVQEILEFNVTNVVTHVEEKLSEQSVHIYPNPAKDEVHILFGESSKKWLQLYDLAGKLHLQCEAFADKTLSLTHLSAGMYVLKVKGERKEWSCKIVKK